MTFDEMFGKVSKLLNKAKIAKSTDDIAIQFSVTGDGSGTFYAKISNGKMDVQPYDYRDNDISVFVDASELISALENKKGDTLAFVGNEAKIETLKSILIKIPASRTTSSKAGNSKTDNKTTDSSVSTTKAKSTTTAASKSKTAPTKKTSRKKAK